MNIGSHCSRYTCRDSNKDMYGWVQLKLYGFDDLTLTFIITLTLSKTLIPYLAVWITLFKIQTSKNCNQNVSSLSWPLTHSVLVVFPFKECVQDNCMKLQTKVLVKVTQLCHYFRPWHFKWCWVHYSFSCSYPSPHKPL